MKDRCTVQSFIEAQYEENLVLCKENERRCGDPKHRKRLEDNMLYPAMYS